MKNEELLSVLIQTNKLVEKPVDDEILEQILSLIILNPLIEDRGRCQAQIKLLISQKGEDKIK